MHTNKILIMMMIAYFSVPVENAKEGLTKGIPVYLIIFIFSLVFQVALATDAVSSVFLRSRYRYT